jgi:hypothetical protein
VQKSSPCSKQANGLREEVGLLTGSSEPRILHFLIFMSSCFLSGMATFLEDEH